MHLTRSISILTIFIIFIASCSSVQVTEESVRESSIATVEVSTDDSYSTSNLAMSVSATVYFDFDKFNLTSRSIQALRGVVSTMSENTEITIVIEGHADDRGTREYNLALGCRLS